MHFLKRRQSAAVPWKKALPDDIIIPVMGPTGVGKSTFINHLAGGDEVKVGRDLRSCTANLQPVTIPPSQNPLLGGRRLVIVDTPGFDDTYVSDSVILGHIASWLADAYRSETKLSGVIYLHDISLARMLGTTRKNLEVFQKLCGDDALRSVILGTTKWGEVYKEEGERRITQLCEHYWKDMLEHGSKVYRFEDSSASAWALVGSIIETSGNRAEVLKIQEELVDMLKLLPGTEAGQKLRGDLDQVLKKLKEDLKNHKKDAAKRQELGSQITQIRAQMKAMHIPVSQRVSRFLNLGVDKILDRFALTVRVHQPPIALLGADCRELILLLGESREAKKTLLSLLSAKEHDSGNGQDSSTQEVKYWSVARQGTFMGTPGFDSGGDTLEVFQKIWIWLQNSCREDVQVGVIYLKDAIPPATGTSSTFSPGVAPRVGNTHEWSSPVVSGSNFREPSDPIALATQRPPFPPTETACTSVARTLPTSPNKATPPLHSTTLVLDDNAVPVLERPQPTMSDLEVVYGAAPAAVASQERAHSAHVHESPARLHPPLASSSASPPGNPSAVASNGIANAVLSAEKPVAQYQSSSLKESQLAPPQITIPSTLPPSLIEWFQSSPLAETTLFATLTAAKVHTSEIDEPGGKVGSGFTEFQSTQYEALKMLDIVRHKALPFVEMLQPEDNKDKLKSKKGLLTRLLHW